MSKKTKISWCHSTASPWYGCTKVSPGCANCYAESWAKRSGKDIWGKGKARQRSKSFDRNCRGWNRKAGLPRAGCKGPYPRPRIFPSLCDWLDEDVPIEWLADCLETIRCCPNLDFLLLTKRPENFNEQVTLAQDFHFDHGDRNVSGWIQDWWKHDIAPDNVWLGVSVEDQERADERIPELLKIPAKVRFLSVEPLLGPIRFSEGFHVGPLAKMGVPPIPDVLRKPFIDWIIVGGESGPHYRDCGVESILDVVKQCKAAGVPVWIKQDAARFPEAQGRIPDEFFQLKQLPSM